MFRPCSPVTVPTAILLPKLRNQNLVRNLVLHTCLHHLHEYQRTWDLLLITCSTRSHILHSQETKDLNVMLSSRGRSKSSEFLCSIEDVTRLPHHLVQRIPSLVLTSYSLFLSLSKFSSPDYFKVHCTMDALPPAATI